MLLLKLMEECSEVSQRCSKAIRFGLEEIQPEQLLNNRVRLYQEISDLITVLKMLSDENILDDYVSEAQLKFGKERVEKYFNYSKELGVLK